MQKKSHTILTVWDYFSFSRKNFFYRIILFRYGQFMAFSLVQGGYLSHLYNCFLVGSLLSLIHGSFTLCLL